MINVVINPGTWTTEGNAKQAMENIKVFVQDLKLSNVIIKKGRPFISDNGRYRFTLKLGWRATKIEMPGESLDKVRFIQEKDQNVWNFPRLYVDGNSWLWCFAVNMAKEDLTAKLRINETV